MRDLAKRAFDILVAAAVLTVTMPLWVAAALAVKLADGGPVLFGQDRVGLGGRTFRMLKFRSMIPDAEAQGPHFTGPGDPRVTPVGRWLRRTSLDELPQLLNVLRGDMSLIGPRPDTPKQRALYSDVDWALRCSVRPGMTGLAQVTEKRLDAEGTSRESRLALDLDYVRARSLALDLSIIGRTVAKVARLKNN